LSGGWERRRALLFNLLSALTFLAGGLLAYAASLSLDVTFLLPFAAGNFIYIAASDLIPEVKEERDWRVNLLHFACFVAGIALLYSLRVALEG
jgi:zinc and cadmium transporter